MTDCISSGRNFHECMTLFQLKIGVYIISLEWGWETASSPVLA